MDLYTIRNELNSGKSIYDLNLRVTFYARVSTDKDEQLHSLSAQISYYNDFIKNNSNWTFVDGYIDEGISGTSVIKREQFLKMIDDAQSEKFDFIVTKEISRFSRNTLDSIKYTQQLLSYGVGVLFQSDNINTLMPDAELRLTIMSSIAQDEVRKISERVKFGFKRAIENGVVLGNNKIWGYEKDNGKLVIKEDEAEMIELIFDIYANQQLGIRGVCSELTKRGYKNNKGNNFSFSTIRGILTNPKYKGYYCGGKTHKYDYKINDRKMINEDEWVMYKDEEAVPPIVSEELWNKANSILMERSKKMSSKDKTSYQNKYPYSGKIICMEHNTLYYHNVYKYKTGDKGIWQCKIYSERGKKGCSSPIIYTTELDEVMKQVGEIVIQNKSEIINKLSKRYTLTNGVEETKNELQKRQAEINNFLKKKDKLLDLTIKGKLSDDEFEIRNNTFNQEIENLKVKVKELKEQEIKNKEMSYSIKSLRSMISNELDFDGKISKEISDALLNKIEVYNTGTKNQIDLKIFLKVPYPDLKFSVNRGKKHTSVCYEQYILYVTKRSMNFIRGQVRYNQHYQQTFDTQIYIQLA